MFYDQFLRGIKWTRSQWASASLRRNLPFTSDYDYLMNKAGVNWLHLEKMGINALSSQVITGVLNTAAWNCHLPGPSKPQHKQMVANLNSAVNKLAPYYAALKGSNVYDIDFFGNVLLGNTSSPTSLVVGEIYAEFCSIKPVFGKVPASKLMHMALPDLFVMWDNAIIKEYHVPSYPSDNPQYLPFLVLMQENAQHIKATSPTGLSLSWEDFLPQVNKQCGYASLSVARLLDIANYAVAHHKKGAPSIRCRDCCGKANARLSKLELLIGQYTGSRLSLGRFRC